MDASGRTVLLRGVNRSGLEYSIPDSGGFLSGAAFSQLEIETIVHRWGCNVIRLPFNQQFVLEGFGEHDSEAYLSAFDQIIDWAASAGAYTLLDLQWLDLRTSFGELPGGSINQVPPLPDARTHEMWTVVARRYRDEPAVLFDLFNEPHHPLDSDTEPLHLLHLDGSLWEGPAEFVGPEEWVPWARSLTAAIRTEHPESLVFVSGVDWAFDLRDIDIGAANVVYSAHVYPSRSPRDWMSYFGHVGAHHPLFVAEWGGGDADLRWGSRLVSFMRRHCCGWTAWSWMDKPLLVLDARAGDYSCTPFGELVRAELLA